MTRRYLAPVLMAMALAACEGSTGPAPARPESPTSATASAGIAVVTPSPPTPSTSPTPLPRWVTARPAWLGKRVLPPGIDGFGAIRPTPPILRNRRFPTIDVLPPPDGRRFIARIGPVPRAVAERSSWRPRCPVSLEELAYIRMPFWGFDRRLHMGEMLTNAAVAESVVGAFRRLFEARFPIEEMRVASLKEVREWRTKPTGDTNMTSSFECRKATQGTSWSQHAYGLAIDINPFHNPYLRGEVVGPELASAYLNRDWERPGMIFEGDVVVDAFDAIGWGWGGRWTTLKDWMHFSVSGS